MKEDTLSLAATTFGKNLRKLRKARNLTQEKLAEELGISTKHVGDLEKGKSFTSGEVMDSIARYFDVGFEELFVSEGKAHDTEMEAMHIALDMLKKNTEAFERRVIELHVKEKEDLQ